MNENQNYYNSILNNINYFLKIKEKAYEFCKINKTTISLDNKQNDNILIYPINFYIVYQNIFDKFCQILDLKDPISEKVLLTFNKGSIVFRGADDINFCDNKIPLNESLIWYS